MCADPAKMVDKTIAGVKKNPLSLLGAVNPWGQGAWISALGSAYQSGKK